MATLTDFLDVETLQQFQDTFAKVGRMPLRLCAPDGAEITRPSEVPYEPWEGKSAPATRDKGKSAGPARRAVPACDVPVRVGGKTVGRIVMGAKARPGRRTAPASPEISPGALRYLGLMADVLGRMCEREKQIRSRVDELATLYRLTAEFTARHDLQGLLDRVAATVVHVLKAKACSIRLLSEDRRELVVKAVANMSPEYLSKGPILASESQIDQEALTAGRAVYIADERNDPRVLYPAEARREGIVSALCAPLVYRGRPEGVIHLYSGAPRTFDPFEVSLLMVIAGQAAAAIVNARLYAEAVRSADMRQALETAGEVQRRMIPAQASRAPGFDIAALYVPTYELSGDFYDFIELPADNLGVAICDVVGKGVRAALLTASIRAGLRAHATDIYDMSKVLRNVNRDLCNDVLTSDFATLFYGVLDCPARNFTYANAGHPPPLLFREGKASSLPTRGLVIGVDPSASWHHDSIALRKDDFILAYTDGLTDAMNFRDEPFGLRRIEQAVAAALADRRTAEGVLSHVLWEMRRFVGLQTRFDDLTMVAIRAL